MIKYQYIKHIFPHSKPFGKWGKLLKKFMFSSFLKHLTTLFFMELINAKRYKQDLWLLLVVTTNGYPN